MIIKINFDNFESREEFHQWLKQQCQFPEYYGCNLDAMYDCLTENSNFVFEIENDNLKSYHAAIINVMQEAGCKVIMKRKKS